MTSKREVVCADNAYNFTQRKILLAGMQLLVMCARHENVDFKTYPGVELGHVDPKVCDKLTYRMDDEKREVRIDNPYGDYMIINIKET